jgi:hypothetical protein
MEPSQTLITNLQSWFFTLLIAFFILAGLTLLVYALLIW